MSLNEEATGRIKVVKTPDGEAPLWVREAWVGLILPCYPYLGVPPESPRGVLTNEKIEKVDARDVICTECAGIESCGVSIPQDLAIAEITKQHDEPDKKKAAAWWKEHGFPQPKMNFFFHETDIVIVSGVTELPMVVADDMETGHWEVPDMR